VIKLKKILKEDNLVVVDIQPEYEKAFTFDPREFVATLFTTDWDAIYYLYNGADTVGGVSEDELKDWIAEKSQLEYEEAYQIMDKIEFYDKGYAFFRYCIDEGIDDDNIVALIKFMVEKNVNDSRDLDEEFWDEFVDRYKEYLDLKPADIRELLEFSGDMINIPELMDFLKRIRGKIILVGGGLEECLKEVVIALRVLDKQYKIDDYWTY